MDYEAIDREMSSWVVVRDLEGTRFYLTDDGLISDIPSHARLFRWEDGAEDAARFENGHPAPYETPTWKAIRVAEDRAGRLS